MMRSQIQLHEDQHRRLRKWSQKLGISLSEAVRRCVEEGLAREEKRPSHEERVKAALGVCGKYRDPKGASRVAAEHDKHLAEAYGE
jgi:hypothetical protein